MARVYFGISDNGDGSSSVLFFDHPDCLEYLIENNPEQYACNDCADFFDYEGTLSNIDIWTLDYVRGMCEHD